MNIDLLTEPFNLKQFQEKVNNILYPYDIDIQKIIKDHSLDPKKVENFINNFDPEYRKPIEYILSKIKHISWKEFKDSFFELANDIKDQIKGDYGFILPNGTEYNSESFFTSLAYKEVFSKWKEPISCGYTESLTNNIIYVDDGSYSGTQLIEFLKDVIIFKKDILSSKPTNFPIILVDRNIDLPILQKENEYYITVNISKNLYTFHSKSDNKKYFSSNQIGVLDFKLILKLVEDLNDFNKLHSDTVFIKDTHKLQYIDINKIKILLSIINVWICIPYISEETAKKLNDLEKKNSKYIRIHYAEPTKYRLYTIIQDSPHDIKTKVIELIKCYMKYYSKYLRQSEIELQDIPVFPIYFDHKVASIMSTLSVIIGCGIVINPSDCKAVFVGPLIKNCELRNDVEKTNIDKLIYNLYSSYTVQKSDTQVCSICPKTVYSMKEEDIKKLL